MDALFPEDNKITISIIDKKTLWKDVMIGSVELDLEDRFFYNKKRCEYFAIDKLRKHCKKTLQETSDRKKITKIKKKLTKYEKLMSKQKIDFIKQNPIEYKSLSLDKYSLNRGSLEFLIDILTEKEEKNSPPLLLEKPKNALYELRLIIWSLKNIKSPKKQIFDLFVRAQISTQGWTSKTLSKETDVHMMSKGDALYNYRMKFPFSLPCAFPRLKIAIFDFETFSTDEAISETTIEFENVFDVLKKENYFFKEKIGYQLFFDGQENGQVFVSFEILPESEVCGNLVGEGQEEPNCNPYLEKPREGRGIKDFVNSKSFGFFGAFGFFRLLRYWKGILAAFLIGVVFFILFVYPGIFVK